MINKSKIWDLNFGSKKEAVDFTERAIKQEDYGKKGKYSWDIDHAIPVSKDGSDTYYNLLPMHHLSNDNKGQKTSWTDEGRRYQVKSFKTLRKAGYPYRGKGYGYCLLNDDGTYEVIAVTKDVTK